MSWSDSIAQLRTAANRPIDSASLIVFRILFGFLMVVEVWRYLDHNWVSSFYIKPDYFFHYDGFSWIKPWSERGMYWHFYGIGLAALGIMFGAFYRLSAITFFLLFTYIFLLDQTRYLNHFYFISLLAFILCFLSPHRGFSFDSRKAEGGGEATVPAWMLWSLKVQLAIVYVYGGIAKINVDWLIHGQPLETWLNPGMGIPFIGALIKQSWSTYFFAWSGLLIDLFGVPLLLWRRTRPFMFVIFVMFHLMNARLFSIGIFPWLGIASTTLFLDPSWPRRIFNWPLAQANLTKPLAIGIQPGITTVLIMFFVIQCLVPLRHHLIQGDVAWTEEGHMFSWRMKLRSKSGKLTFRVTNPDTGITRTVKLRDHLKKKQIRKMAGRPGMIHQFAQYLAEAERREGEPRLQVRVRAEVSLNGSSRFDLIDTSVDLASTERYLLKHNDWITMRPPREKD